MCYKCVFRNQKDDLSRVCSWLFKKMLHSVGISKRQLFKSVCVYNVHSNLLESKTRTSSQPWTSQSQLCTLSRRRSTPRIVVRQILLKSKVGADSACPVHPRLEGRRLRRRHASHQSRVPPSLYKLAPAVNRQPGFRRGDSYSTLAHNEMPHRISFKSKFIYIKSLFLRFCDLFDPPSPPAKMKN